MNAVINDSDSMLHREIGARLHSARRPELEAARYIDALDLSDDTNCFILIEPGMGYLIPALRGRFPGSTVVALHADNCFRLTQDNYPGVPMWFPECGTSVQDFLEAAVPEAASTRLIEWRPGLRVYGDLYLGLVRETTEFILRSAAGRRTGVVFGKRWVRNFFRNLTLADRTLLYRTMDIPIIITGSGPSLESALPQISAARESVFILAASSSLAALAAGGILPDMAVATDGGGWALLHLHACFRRNNIPHSPLPTSYSLAFSLSAALPSQCCGLPLLPMNDGSLWQSMALHSVGLPSVLIPQRGTVTASALELALVLSSGAIFLAGMDFAVRDIRSHARPYGFDHLFSGTASRLRSVYSQSFERSSDMRAGGSHDVYAAWFKNKIAAWPKRIFSLGGNHAVLENNLPPLPPPRNNGARTDRTCFKLVTTNYSPADRRERAVETLIAALSNPQYADALKSELAPLLFPSRSGVPPDDVQPAQIAGALRGL